MEWLFWGSLVLILYSYFGFPLLVAIKAWLWPRKIESSSITPTIDVLIAAHNEADCIVSKIESVLDAEYPSDRIRIIVASDGSDDGTDELVASYPDERVQLVRVERAGKAMALNAGLTQCHGEVLVFTDANSIFCRNSLSCLVSPLGDDSVGAVAGNQQYQKGRNESTSAAGERGYWSYDRLLKRLESRAGNAISATGAIYAIRRALVDQVPVGVTDDFAVSTGAIEQGYRLVFAEDAVAIEPVSDSSRVEFGRKIRVMTRGFRSVLLRRALLNPFRYGFYSIQLFSHKLLRRLMVFPLIVLLISSFCLWNSGVFYQLAAVTQAIFYAMALMPLMSRALARRKLLALPYFFCLANTAALVAFFRCLRGGQVAMWNPQRTTSTEG